MIPEIPKGFLSEIKTIVADIYFHLDKDPRKEWMLPLVTYRAHRVTMILDYSHF